MSFRSAFRSGSTSASIRRARPGSTSTVPAAARTTARIASSSPPFPSSNERLPSELGRPLRGAVRAARRRGAPAEHLHLGNHRPGRPRRGASALRHRRPRVAPSHRQPGPPDAGGDRPGAARARALDARRAFHRQPRGALRSRERGARRARRSRRPARRRCVPLPRDAGSASRARPLHRHARCRSHPPRKHHARYLEHIFTGYDHIAFLIGLLLLGGSFKELVQIVTAFTVAHSITLALATLAVVNPTSRVVEPLIAASIVYVAAENLWALRRGTRAKALRHRWMLTFAFGLVHGFGFATVLRELHLPRSGLAAALVTFNLGVEVGQLCIVAAAFPLLSRLRRARGFDPAGVRAASACVGALGLFWLVQRLAGG
ncbi:MAG: HupE/UreJ family protein [Deltaproteobacteria bacterium]|nr:MAG: HupE/UreJ family protein [Deltaproteobacteria bacterium]